MLSQEPAAVEGFLTILTNGKGKSERGRRRYFTSHDHFLFYTKPKFVKKSPSPVTTIMNATTGQQCQSDERNDRERRINHIKHSLGFIDLTEIARVELSQGVRSNLSNPAEEQPSSVINSKIMLLVLKNGLAVTLEVIVNLIVFIGLNMTINHFLSVRLIHRIQLESGYHVSVIL